MIKAVLDSGICLSGLSKTQRSHVEKDLTFRNPRYDKIMKYSKWGTTREPMFIEYFRYVERQGETFLRVPAGYKVPFECDYIDLREITYDLDFPEFLMTLRPTQSEALASYFSANKGKNHLCGGIQLPTGKGKTILGLAIASTLRQKTLILVHKNDLVTGWLKDIDLAFGGKADTGLIKVSSRKVGKHFTVATVQTLSRMTEKELNILYSTFGLVIQDEMHHCPSSTFAIADNFKSRYRLGLTATPERSDGLAHVMNLYYGDFCFTYKHQSDDEDILPVNVIKREVSTVFDPVLIESGKSFKIPENFNDPKHFDIKYKLKMGEVRVSDISYYSRPPIPFGKIDLAVTSHSDTVKQVCDDLYKEYNEGHSCIAFFLHVETVELYFNKLISDYGIPCENIGLYYGANKDCDSVLTRAESKRKFITLATYSKATEGTNVKQWEVGFLVSSLNNGKNVEQAVGRIRRKSDKDKLKTARLYDYRYSKCCTVSRHGSTRDARYTLLHFNVNGNEISDKKTTGKLFSKGFKKSV